MKKSIKVFGNLCWVLMFIITVIIISWAIISYFDIMFSNRSIAGAFDRLWDWNFFKVLVNLGTQLN